MKYILLFFIALISSCEPRFFNAPTPSMESTIATNSKIFVNYGEVHRNDIIVFKAPSDLGTYFIFRMIAEPGDELRISNGKVFINGMRQIYPGTIQHRYLVETSTFIKDRYFEESGIKEYAQIPAGYILFTTQERANKLGKEEFIKSVRKDIAASDLQDDRLYVDFRRWNKDNIGPFHIPKIGDRISGNELQLYAGLILENEGVNIENLKEYQFTKSYCFVMGDNRDNALDSRYIGLIPMDKVLGSAVLL